MTTLIYVPDSSTLLVLQDALNYALAACDDMTHQGMESAFTGAAEYDGFRGRQRALRDALGAIKRASAFALAQASQEAQANQGLSGAHGVAAELSRIVDRAMARDRRTAAGVQVAAECIVEDLLGWGRRYHVDVVCAVYVRQPEIIQDTDTVDALRHAGGDVLPRVRDNGTVSGTSREARFPMGTTFQVRRSASFYRNPPLFITTPNGAQFRLLDRVLSVVSRAPNGPELSTPTWERDDLQFYLRSTVRSYALAHTPVGATGQDVEGIVDQAVADIVAAVTWDRDNAPEWAHYSDAIYGRLNGFTQVLYREAQNAPTRIRRMVRDWAMAAVGHGEGVTDWAGAKVLRDLAGRFEVDAQLLLAQGVQEDPAEEGRRLGRIYALAENADTLRAHAQGH